MKDADATQNSIRERIEVIHKRLQNVTSFGEECNIELDDIAVFLYEQSDLRKLWVKILKGDEEVLSKQTSINKLLYAVTVSTVKRKNPKAKKPPREAIKNLTKRVCRELPKKKLTKQFFAEELYKLLFKLHDAAVKEEE